MALCKTYRDWQSVLRFFFQKAFHPKYRKSNFLRLIYEIREKENLICYHLPKTLKRKFIWFKEERFFYISPLKCEEL